MKKTIFAAIAAFLTFKLTIASFTGIYHLIVGSVPVNSVESPLPLVGVITASLLSAWLFTVYAKVSRALVHGVRYTIVHIVR